jgi:hypothetical protein
MSDKFIHKFSNVLNLLFEAFQEGLISKEEKVKIKQILFEDPEKFDEINSSLNQKYEDKSPEHIQINLEKIRNVIYYSSSLASTIQSQSTRKTSINIKDFNDFKLQEDMENEGNISRDFFSEKEDY